MACHRREDPIQFIKETDIGFCQFIACAYAPAYVGKGAVDLPVTQLRLDILQRQSRWDNKAASAQIVENNAKYVRVAIYENFSLLIWL
jgi:hypothetical protein